ncbi:SHOCT domain-containing protein [Amycolatopsis nigrescens]|uniref:SHOCT domain-containing protein n=1 Tax=Amycolatopsis nigrescens TaxID=381445 RepID=UPI0003797422|nr:hypothetical protein [Amycolatopsis nigrescens]
MRWDDNRPGWGGWDGGWGYSGGPSWVGWIFIVVTMLLFWAALITVITVAVKRSRRAQQAGPQVQAGPSPAAGPASPEAVLANRFALGEIDEEEYVKRRETLRSS